MPVQFEPPSAGMLHPGQEAALSQPGELRLREHADGLAFWRQQEGKTGKSGQCAQGGNGWIDPQHGDDQTIEHACDHTEHDASQDGNEDVIGGQELQCSHGADAHQHGCGDHRADRSDRANRDIERAGDDDHRLTNRQQPHDDNRLCQAVPQVLPGEELIAAFKTKPAAYDCDQKARE